MTAPPAPAAAQRDRPLDPEGKGERRAPRLGLRIALFAAGLAVIVALLALVGWEPIVANLERIGWWLPALVVLYGIAQLAFAVGWWTLTGPPHPTSFRELFAAYLAGDSINYFTSVGGEPVKAHLLRGKMGFSRAFATVAVHRHADVLAQWLFLVAGVTVALTQFELPTAIRIFALLGLLLLGGALLGVTRALRKGAFQPFLRWLSRFRALRDRVARFERSAEKVDARIATYYGEGERVSHFAAATLWGFVGWCGQLLETYLILRLLAPGHGLVTAIAIESLAMTLNNILLLFPARIGTAEGVRVGVFLLLGLTAAQGAAYGIARRARELIWLLPGLVILLKHHLVDVAHLRLQGLSEDEVTP